MPVTSADGSALSHRYMTPPRAPPGSGATQNSQSCASAQPPTNSAGPVLRAGFTEGVRHWDADEVDEREAEPIASGAKPAGALPCVAPMMTNRKTTVSTTSRRPGMSRTRPASARRSRSTRSLATSKPGAPLAMT